MAHKLVSKLNPRKRYLQIALNSTLQDAQKIISQMPLDERILIEAGTPLLKRHGKFGLEQISAWYKGRAIPAGITPYVVADLKTMDRAETEVKMAAEAGASAIIALGNAPLETLNSFIEQSEAHGLDPMIDMMNVAYPLAILSKLKKIPPVVILHRGVDEEKFNKERQIPLHEIRRIKGAYDIMISIAGGDTIREVQRSIFNDADIVVIWKSVFQSTNETVKLVEGFLKEIK